MGFETPKFEGEKVESKDTKLKPKREEGFFESAEYQALRGVVDSVFESPDKMREYLEPLYQKEPNLLTEQKIEDRFKSFSYELSITPRFGDNEEYIQKLREKSSGLSSPAEKVALLEGLTEFRGHRNAGRIVSALERAKKEHRKPELKETDDLFVEGHLLRSIFDQSVMGFSIVNNLDFAKRYEDATGKHIITGLAKEYERMLNAPDHDVKVVEFDVIDRLKKAGLEVEPAEERGKRYSVTWRENLDRV